MENLIILLFSEPAKAATGILIVVVGWFVLRDYGRREKQFELFSQKMSYWNSKFSTHSETTKKIVDDHKDAMGKATKAINGDMIQIKESILNLKQQLLEQITLLKNQAAEIERDFKSLEQAVKLSVEKINEKYEAVEVIKKELDEVFGRVILKKDSKNGI